MATVTVTTDDAISAISSFVRGHLTGPVALAVPSPRAADGAAEPNGAAVVAAADGVAVAAAQGPAIAATRTEIPEHHGRGQEPAVATANTRWWLRLLIAIAAIAGVLIAWAIIVQVVHDPATKFGILMPKPVNGTTIFAVFFVAAAAIERFLEPISGLLPDKTDLSQEAHDAKAAAGRLFLHGRDPDAAKAKLQHAAQKEADAKDWVFGQTVGFWALATIISMLASALLKLYMPYVVGIASGGRAFQILATGLIIGSGTKPLHDLVGYMSAAKDSKLAAK